MFEIFITLWIIQGVCLFLWQHHDDGMKNWSKADVISFYLLCFIWPLYIPILFLLSLIFIMIFEWEEQDDDGYEYWESMR